MIDITRREAAQLTADALEGLLDYAQGIGGGVPAEYETPLPIEVAFAILQRTFSAPYLLPEPAQSQWTLLHRMIDGGRRRDGEFAAAEAEVLFLQTANQLRAWLYHEFRLTAPAGDPEAWGPGGSWGRLHFDVATNTISLDWVPWTAADPREFKLVWHLYQASIRGERRTDDQLVGELYPGERRDPRVVRHLKARVGEPIKSCIKSRENLGTWLQLPPR